MKKCFRSISLMIMTLLLFTGCASNPLNIGDFFGISMTDLEKARKNGVTTELAMTKDEAFDKIIDISKKNNLLVYQKNKEKGYVVVMGFQKQTNTTRVGIFLDPAGEGKTKMTLSSPSSTALVRAKGIFFVGLGAAL